MNLRTAIQRGATKAERIQGSFYQYDKIDGTVRCCPWGAAYLACHPDADLTLIIWNEIANWMKRFERLELEDGRAAAQLVMTTNDYTVDAHEGFAAVIHVLERYRLRSGAPLLDLEVCS
jgi:hypothetical protein